MRVTRVFIVLAILFLLAPLASAEVRNTTYYDSGCAEDMTTSGCFELDDPEPTTIYGGQYSVCKASGRFNQGCWEIANKPVDSTGTKFVKQCVKISHNASCACDSVKLSASGSCTYYP